MTTRGGSACRTSLHVCEVTIGNRHQRYKGGAVAGQTMAHLYGAVRLYVNYFQPSFQLLAKSRNGGSVTKRYSKPATPCDRLLDRDDVSEETKLGLRKGRS